MSFNLFSSDGALDQANFLSVMRGLEFINTLGKSASMATTHQGGDNPKPIGVSSDGVTSATHNSPMGQNSTSSSRTSRANDSTNTKVH